MSRATGHAPSLPVPEWIAAYVRLCLDAFGVADWPVFVGVYECIEGHPEWRGLATSNPRNLWARLQFRADLAPDLEGYRTLTHECLHVALALQGTALTFWRADLPKRTRRRNDALWADANEQTVERLSRALTPLLQAQLRVPEADHDAAD